MSESPSQWRGWVVAAAIFVLGVGVGAAGMAWGGIRFFRHVMQNPAANRGLAERAIERIDADLTKNLHLTAEESEQVQTILAQAGANLKGVRTQATTQATAELRAAAQRIAAILPPGKRAKFYRLIAQRYRRFGAPPPVTEPVEAEKTSP
ncbi:MAG TPA: hypothetical protein VGM64_09165 [Lacunisphaera sp.]|jgi:hypothetical protein